MPFQAQTVFEAAPTRLFGSLSRIPAGGIAPQPPWSYENQVSL